MEARLRKDLELYNSQMKSVTTMLAEVEGADVGSQIEGQNQELLEVKTSLEEAIKLTNESLLNLKKAQLLNKYGQASPSESANQVIQSGSSEEGTSGGKGSAPVHNTGHTPSPKDYAFQIDQHVQALWSKKEGAVWMDAVIHDIILPEEGQREESYLVIYETPTSLSMKPCRFLNSERNTCRYGATACKFSHGFVTPRGSIRRRKMGKLEAGGPCLAKYEEDGLWYEASIEKINDDKSVTVCYNGYDQQVTLDVGDIVHLPTIAHRHDKRKGELRSHDREDLEEEGAHPLRGLGSVHHSPKLAARPVDRNFGEWEKHTKGFGMKILEKFGFKRGEGLGRDGTGITEPVAEDEQVVLPHATSIDHVREDMAAQKEKRDLMEARMKKTLEATNAAAEASTLKEKSTATRSIVPENSPCLEFNCVTSTSVSNELGYTTLTIIPWGTNDILLFRSAHINFGLV